MQAEPRPLGPIGLYFSWLPGAQRRRAIAEVGLFATATGLLAVIPYTALVGFTPPGIDSWSDYLLGASGFFVPTATVVVIAWMSLARHVVLQAQRIDVASDLPERPFDGFTVRGATVDDAVLVSQTIDSETVRATGWAPIATVDPFSTAANRFRRRIEAHTSNPVSVRCLDLVVVTVEDHIVGGATFTATPHGELDVPRLDFWLCAWGRSRIEETTLLDALQRIAFDSGLDRILVGVPTDNSARSAALRAAGAEQLDAQWNARSVPVDAMLQTPDETKVSMDWMVLDTQPG